MSEMRPAARAIFNQRRRVTERLDILRRLGEAVAWPNDLTLSQACHLYALALEFRPQLIVELGRGYGNSTCVFTQAANDLPKCRVISLCLSDAWRTESWPRVRDIVGDEWAAPLDARVENIQNVDFDRTTEGAERVLVFWDAHGISVADCVLARLMPAIAHRPHMVAMHDMSDARYAGPAINDYEGLPFWRGQEQAMANETARLRLDWLATRVDQAIPVLDFLVRNGLALHSADHDVHLDIMSQPERRAALREALSADCFDSPNHWAYFSLDGAPGPLRFPAYGGGAASAAAAGAPAPPAAAPAAAPATGDGMFRPDPMIAELGRVLQRDLAMYNFRGRATPLTWARVLAKTVLGRYRRHVVKPLEDRSAS